MSLDANFMIAASLEPNMPSKIDGATPTQTASLTAKQMAGVPNRTALATSKAVRGVKVVVK